MNDTPKAIHEKCKKAVSDGISTVTYDPHNRPGVSNLISIHVAICPGKTPEEICNESKDMDTLAYKLMLAQLLTEKLAPIREESEYLLNNKDHLEAVLRQGEHAAREIASRTIDEVSKLVGFI